MPFSYDRTWQDTMVMLRANWVLLLTITGAFVFFPAFAMFVYVPAPEAKPDATAALTLDAILTYFQQNMLWFVLVNAVSAFAQAAILTLLLDRGRPTVGEALGLAGALFPSYFIVELLTNFMTGAGLVLLLVPGIYLLGRFAVCGPVVMDRRIANPFRAIGEAWQATEKRGWRIAGLMLLVIIVAWIALSAATSVLTVVLALVVPEAHRPLVGGATGALSSAALSLLLVVLTAAIYRQIVGDSRIGEVFR